MKFLALLASAAFLLSSLSATATASAIHHDARAHSVSTRHSRLARDLNASSSSRLAKRCKAKAPASSSKKHKPTGSATTAKPKATTSKAGAPASTPAASPKGVIDVTTCGATGATTKITATTGPNGSIDWLNRGITGSGWNPCHVTVDQVITTDLNTALKQSNSPFQACSQFISLFNQYGDEFGVAPIMLASFAMQESSCQPDAQGEGGEQGLMQLSQDKCGDAPGGNCKDPNYNIKTGAKFFSDTLASNNGNVLLTVGNYNGWSAGMTQAQATAAANTDCCRCQNNLDYLDQYFNGWLQNVPADGLGKFFNLAGCP